MFKRTLQSRLPSLAITLIAACAISACGIAPLGPNYERPALDLPTSLTRIGTATNVDWLVWWKGFNDPVLDGLLQEAASNSQDLALPSPGVASSRLR